MKMKKLFESQLRQQQTEIARQALKQAFRGNMPPKVTMAELLDELQEDELLWDAFRSLTFSEFKDMLSPSADSYGPPGPSRKRGVTAKRIIDYLRENPGTRRNEIMTALGLKGGTVSSQLRTLRASGRIQGEGEERNLQYYPAE